MCEKVPYVKIFEFFLQKRFLKLHGVLLIHLKPSSSVSNYKKVINTCSLRRCRWVSWAGWPCRGSRTPSSPSTASGVDDEHQQSTSISSTSSPWTSPSIQTPSPSISSLPSPPSWSLYSYTFLQKQPIGPFPTNASRNGQHQSNNMANIKYLYSSSKVFFSTVALMLFLFPSPIECGFPFVESIFTRTLTS